MSANWHPCLCDEESIDTCVMGLYFGFMVVYWWVLLSFLTSLRIITNFTGVLKPPNIHDSYNDPIY